MNRRERRRALRLGWFLLGTLLLAMGLGLAMDRIVVTGPSMAPSVYGLSDGYSRSDTVLVYRWAYWFGEPRRFDTVVFRHPEDPERQLVKRIAGLPGEEIRIEQGELVVDGRRLVKSDEEWERVRVLLFDLERHDAAEFWNLREPLEAVLGPGHRVLDSGTFYNDYRRADGHRARGQQPVGDVEVELDLERRGDVVSIGRIDLPQGIALVWEWGAGAGMAEVLSRPSGEVLERLSLRAAGERLRIRFREVDGISRLRLERGASRETLLNWEASLPVRAEEEGRSSPHVRIELEGAGTRVRGLRTWRDLYYTSTADGFGVRRPVRLGSRSYFMLGDNSADSSDSREFGEIARDAILGRVDWVVSPWDRIRSVP